MSFPTREFRRLSIRGNMAAPRGEERASHDPADSQSSADDDSSGRMRNSSESAGGEVEGAEEEESESAEASTFQARSGITYDLAELDSESEAKAVVGLTGRFDVVECVAAHGGYDFQLSDQPRVHVGSDRDTCTCSAFQRQPGAACQHIFWLLDQVRGCLPQRLSNDVPISNAGRSPGLPPVKRFLDNNIDSIADQLDCQYHRGEAEEGMTRPQKVRDIMSAFETAILPEDFRLDLVDSASQRRTPEQCVVQGDLEATMFRLAVHDDLVYTRLCKAMPPGATAAIYFDKILERTRKLLVEFDRFCQTGRRPADGTDVSLSHVLHTLHQAIVRIHANITTRSPHGTSGAAKALVTLLEDISARNKDCLDGTRTGQTNFHGEDEDQRNLYHQLIGREDEDESSSSPRRAPFLDALELLSGAELNLFAARLRTVLRRNEVFPAPRTFLVRLSALVRAAEAGTAASGMKRGWGVESGSSSKRTR